MRGKKRKEVWTQGGSWCLALPSQEQATGRPGHKQEGHAGPVARPAWAWCSPTLWSHCPSHCTVASHHPAQAPGTTQQHQPCNTGGKLTACLPAGTVLPISWSLSPNHSYLFPIPFSKTSLLFCIAILRVISSPSFLPFWRVCALFGTACG